VLVIGCEEFKVLVQIKEYVFEDPDFEDTFKTWALENAHHIDLSMAPEENKLEYSALHQQVLRPCHPALCVSSLNHTAVLVQFIELFNKKLDDKIDDEDVTTQAVFERLAHDAESDAMSEVRRNFPTRVHSFDTAARSAVCRMHSWCAFY
jgi:hypothetical protein